MKKELEEERQLRQRAQSLKRLFLVSPLENCHLFLLSSKTPRFLEAEQELLCSARTAFPSALPRQPAPLTPRSELSISPGDPALLEVNLGETAWPCLMCVRRRPARETTARRGITPAANKHAVANASSRHDPPVHHAAIKTAPALTKSPV